MPDTESLPVKLAKQAIEIYVREGRIIEVPADLPDFLQRQAGAFVSLKSPDKSLRGCVGTIEASCDTLAEEIIKNAIAAATQDPRFPAVNEAELSELICSVDVLGSPETVPDESHLDPVRYGVIVQSGSCRGLLLPDIEGVESIDDQVCIAKRKAGLSDNDTCQLKRFTVTRYE